MRYLPCPTQARQPAAWAFGILFIVITATIPVVTDFDGDGKQGDL